MNNPEDTLELVNRLAQRKGIEQEFRDNWGNVHSISSETKRKILSAMGCDVENLAEVKKTIQAGESLEWRSLTEPVSIVSINAPPKELIFQFPVNPELDRSRLPEDIHVYLTIHEEEGRKGSEAFSLQHLTFKEATEVDGVLYLRGSLPFPEGLPLGYHHFYLTLRQAGRRFDQSIKLIVCPDQCYLPSVLKGKGKRAGLMVSLAGLRSGHNWGIGDFGDLKELVRWAIESLRVEVIGLLPLHFLSNKEPYNISPYYPSSRFYRNPIYLNIPEMEEFNDSTKAWKMVMAPETQQLLNELKGSGKVQFEKVHDLKRKILEVLFPVFLEGHWKRAGQETRRQKEFMAYMDQEGNLLDRFAVYCAIEDHFRRIDPMVPTWEQWPLPFQDPASPEVRAFRQEHWQEVLFHKYLQWQVEVQLSEVQEQAIKSGAEIGLYHDLALGIDPWGADAWAWPGFTVPGVKVGSPPDDFSPKGQDWGFYPPHGGKNRQDGYRFFALDIRKNSHPGGALRIDHILRLARLYWIVEGQSPKDGAYVEYPFDELIQVLALESIRNKTLVIGEDLGTLPDQLRERLQKFGIFSYRLFYFEKEEGGNLRSPETYPELALASITTHDLPTLAGFWSMGDLILRKELGLFPNEEQFRLAMIDRINERRRIIDRLQALGFLSEGEALALHAQVEPVLTEELHRAVLSFLMDTKAKLAVLIQEDLFKEKEQMNLPGTVTEHPNWSRKMRYSLEELWNLPEAQKAAALYRDLVLEAGRSVKSSGLNQG